MNGARRMRSMFVKLQGAPGFQMKFSFFSRAFWIGGKIRLNESRAEKNIAHKNEEELSSFFSTVERKRFFYFHRVLIVLNVSKIKKRTRYTCTRIIIEIFPKNIFPWINTFWPVPCGRNGNFYFGGIRDEKWRKSALYGGGKRGKEPTQERVSFFSGALIPR